MITGVRWLAMARLLAQTSSWVITFIVIRLLSPTDYGLQAMVSVVYTLLLLITSSGFDRAIARQKTFGDAELRQMLGFSLLLNTLLLAAVWAAAPLVATYYQEPAVIPVLRALSFGFLLNVFSKIPIGLAWRNLDYRTHALAKLSGTITASLATLLLALLGAGVWALIIGMLVGPAISALYLQFRTRWLVLPDFTFNRAASAIRYAWTISLGFFVWMLSSRLDILLGGRQLDAAELGLYAVALQLCTLPMRKVVPLAHEVLYPAYARLQNDSAAVSGYFHKSLASLSLLLFPGFFGLAAVSAWAVPVLFGERWLGAEHIIAIVALAMPFRVVTAMCNPMLQATGNAGVSLSTGIFASAFTAIALLVGLQWGVTGLAAATLAAAPVVMSVVVWQTRQSSGLSFRTLGAGIAPPLVLSALMAIIIYRVGIALTSELSLALVLILQIIAGIIIYFALAYVFSRNNLVSTVSIIRTSLNRRSRRSE